MTPTASEIREAVDRWRTQSWPKFNKERILELFFNGEALPSDGEADPPPTLGLGQRFVKKPFGHLMSFLDDAPGPVDADIHDPMTPALAQKLGRALDQEVNALAKERLRCVLRATAGRYLVTGRAFLYRSSKWDWLYRPGRLLAPQDAPDDVQSDEFWEWAFLGRMTLGEIDEILLGRRGKEGSKGWNRAGLKALKQWILESPPDKNSVDSTRANLPTNLDEPFHHRLQRQPLDVYYYFRKCEKRSGRFRKVDLHIVSRYNENAEVARKLNQHGITERKLEIKLKGDQKDDRNQVLFSQEYAFDSVHQCLVPFIGDSRVSGDQEMHQVKGEGELVFARLLLQEHLTRGVVEGVSFGVQPNFKFSNKSDAAWARKIAEEGLSPWDEVPQGFELLEKNNAFSGMNAALQLLNSLGFSTSQDAATGDLGNNYGQQVPTNFKAESQLMIGQIQQDVTMRNARWFSSCDQFFTETGHTLLQRPTLWRQGDPGYHDAQYLHQRLQDVHGFQPAEYDPERVRLIARRVGDKQAAIQKAQAILADPNSPPKVRMWAYKQLLAALYNDSVAEDLLPDEPEQPDLNQAQSALLQNSAALASLIPTQPLPGDDPAIHLEQYHRPALLQRVQLLAQQGWMSPIDQMGLEALMQHMAADIQNLPQDLGQIYLQELQGAAQLIQKQIPVQSKGSELDLARRDADRKDAVAQATVAERQSLIESRATGAQQKADQSQFEKQARLAQIADQEMRTNLEVQRTQQESVNEVLSTQPQV